MIEFSTGVWKIIKYENEPDYRLHHYGVLKIIFKKSDIEDLQYCLKRVLEESKKF